MALTGLAQGWANGSFPRSWMAIVCISIAVVLVHNMGATPMLGSADEPRTTIRQAFALNNLLPFEIGLPSLPWPGGIEEPQCPTKRSSAPLPSISQRVTLPPEFQCTYETRFNDLDLLIKAATDAYQLDPELIRAVIRVESNFDPDAVSPAGAMGLMQLMPQTAREVGVKNPFDLTENVFGGARYLRLMMDRYSGDLEKALAAYNWGPANLDRSRGWLPEETKRYVNMVQAFHRFYSEKEASIPADEQ